MHVLMLKDLESVNPSNIAKTKKCLAKIHNDIIYYTKYKRIKEIKLIAKTLKYFLSINSRDVYQNISCTYRHKQFMTEVTRLLSFCLKILETK